MVSLSVWFDDDDDRAHIVEFTESIAFVKIELGMLEIFEKQTDVNLNRLSLNWASNFRSNSFTINEIRRFR